MSHCSGLISPCRIAPLAFFLLLLLLLLGCGSEREDEAITAASAARDIVPREAPDFTLETPEGEPFTLSAHRGDVVIVNFWATWCPPCVVEIPEFVELQEELEDQGVRFVGVSQDTGPAAYDDVKDFREMFSVNYPLILDTGLRVGTLYDVVSLPTTVVVDRHGNIHAQEIGLLSRRDLLRMLDGLLETPMAAVPGAPTLPRQPGPAGTFAVREEPLGIESGEAVRLVDEGAMVVDLRHGSDRASAGAIPIALETDIDALEQTDLPANLGAPVVFVADDEADAWAAASRAASWGYVRAHPLAGGWAAWVEAGLPVEPAATSRSTIN
jgi:peroxiredoxin/rhodanese-related sulfurtransferase